MSLFKTMDLGTIDSIAETLEVVAPSGQEGVLEGITGYVNSPVRSGDCFQMGQGSPSAFLP